jgi:hypothetical protein
MKICLKKCHFFGFTLGFTDSHTPPMPFLNELLALAVGVILLIIAATPSRDPLMHTFRKE